jgi:hypothetical protein
VSKQSIHLEKVGAVVDMLNVLKHMDNNIEDRLRIKALRLITNNGSNLIYLPSVRFIMFFSGSFDISVCLLICLIL